MKLLRIFASFCCFFFSHGPGTFSLTLPVSVSLSQFSAMDRTSKRDNDNHNYNTTTPPTVSTASAKPESESLERSSFISSSPDQGLPIYASSQEADNTSSKPPLALLLLLLATGSQSHSQKQPAQFRTASSTQSVVTTEPSAYTKRKENFERPFRSEHTHSARNVSSSAQSGVVKDLPLKRKDVGSNEPREVLKPSSDQGSSQFSGDTVRRQPPQHLGEGKDHHVDPTPAILGEVFHQDFLDVLSNGTRVSSDRRQRLGRFAGKAIFLSPFSNAVFEIPAGDVVSQRTVWGEDVENLTSEDSRLSMTSARPSTGPAHGTAFSVPDLLKVAGDFAVKDAKRKSTPIIWAVIGTLIILSVFIVLLIMYDRWRKWQTDRRLNMDSRVTKPDDKMVRFELLPRQAASSKNWAPKK